MVMPRPLHTLLASRTGAVAVEFALITPVLLLIILHLLDMGLAFNERMQVESAARAGAQYAMLNPGDQAGVTAAASNATRLDPNDLTVTLTSFCECSNGQQQACGTTCTGGQAVASYLTVTVQKTFVTLFTFAGLSDAVVVEGEATTRVQ